MLVGGFGIGRWFGFRIRIDYSWFVVFALVTWTFAAWEFPDRLPGLSVHAYVAMGAVGALLLFLSVLLHELAHSVVARARGIPVEGITLFIFGGVAEMRMEARRPLDEFLLTVVGPLSSVTLAGLFYVLASVGAAVGRPATVAVASTLAVLNLVLALFNLIPAFPLDGGRILRSVLWRITGDLSAATRWAAAIGRGFGWLLIMAGAFMFLQGYVLGGAWGVLLGWFLSGAATAAARQQELRTALGGVAVGRVMRGPPRVVPAEISVEELAERYFLASASSAFAVARGGRIVGLVSIGDVAGVPYEKRSSMRVWEAMRSLDEVPVAEIGEPVGEVLGRLQGEKQDRALVVSGEQLVGVLTVGDIAAWIERARQLKPRRRGGTRRASEGRPGE